MKAELPIRKRQEKKRKLNNRGMSLIEILVAIMILTVVTGPLLHSFVTAIKLNAKAKEKQRVTTAAQSIMEGFKAYTLEELCLQFYNSQGIDDPSPDTGLFYVVANAHRVQEVDNAGAPHSSITTVPDGEGTVTKFTPSIDNRYTFSLQGVNFEGKLYDAKVELTADMAADMAAIPTVKNLASIEDFDVDTTAMYDQENPNVDSEAFGAIAEWVLANDSSWKVSDLMSWNDKLQEEDIRNTLMENLRVEEKVIELEVENGTNKVTVKTKYQWSVEACDIPYLNDAGEEQNYHRNAVSSQSSYYNPSTGIVYAPWGDTSGAVVQIYPTEETKDSSKLKTISFCYYPAYDYEGCGISTSGVSIPKETITVLRSGQAVNVSLIKQKNPSVSSEVELRTLEEAYKGNVSVTQDGTGWGPDVTFDGGNMDENLADDITPSGDMIDEKPKVLIYTVKVSVYADGEAAAGYTGEPLVVLNGTMYD